MSKCAVSRCRCCYHQNRSGRSLVAGEQHMHRRCPCLGSGTRVATRLSNESMLRKARNTTSDAACPCKFTVDLNHTVELSRIPSNPTHERLGLQVDVTLLRGNGRMPVAFSPCHGVLQRVSRSKWCRGNISSVVRQRRPFLGKTLLAVGYRP